MRFAEIGKRLAGIPYISLERAEILYDFIIRNKPGHILELGIAHGVSSMYIAAALDEIGKGRVTCVDLVEAESLFVPSIDDLCRSTGLGRYVTVHREATSYTWFLKKTIEAQTRGSSCEPLYDLCIIDGCKNWTIDGCAFFLCDKLLHDNGWILFDDYDWTYASTGREQTDGINHKRMGEDELRTPHIERVFSLLVMQHPEYSEFLVQGNTWAWARKTRSPDRKKTLTIDEAYSYKRMLMMGLRRVGLVGK